MSDRPQDSGLFERMAHGYFADGTEDGAMDIHFFNSLTKLQEKKLKQIKILSLIYSALAGTLGVLLLYLVPEIFPKMAILWAITFKLFEHTIEIPSFYLLYGIFLAVAEIAFLVWLNIYSVRKMAVACNFPPKNDPHYELHIRSLVNIGVEKNAKGELSLGLNPWQGYSRFRVVMIFIWTKVRATLSNFAFKLILRRVLGRYAIRAYVDYIGIPVMAGFNMWAANKVMTQARVRILSPGFIQQTVAHLYSKYHNSELFKEQIYDLLQYLAVKKRSFHENHYLLSINLLRAFEIDVKAKHEVHDNFIERLKDVPEEMQDDIAHLIIIGMIIDGKLTRIEKEALDELSKLGVIEYSTKEVTEIMNAFIEGKGKNVLDEKLGMRIEM